MEFLAERPPPMRVTLAKAQEKNEKYTQGGQGGGVETLTKLNLGVVWASLFLLGFAAEAGKACIGRV